MPLNSATSSDYQFRSGGKQTHHNVLYQVFFRRRSRLERFLLVVSACLVVVVVILLAVIASHDHDVPSSQSHSNKSPPLPTSPTGRISHPTHVCRIVSHSVCLMFSSFALGIPYGVYTSVLDCLGDSVQACNSDPALTRLRSASSSDYYTVPRTRTRLGDRAFSVAGPVVWNSLPAAVSEADSLHSFRCKLKTHLFTLCFND